MSSTTGSSTELCRRANLMQDLHAGLHSVKWTSSGFETGSATQTVSTQDPQRIQREVHYETTVAIVRDRIVQTAMKLVLEPIFEADFHPCSYGYRPQRSAKMAAQPKTTLQSRFRRAFPPRRLVLSSFSSSPELLRQATPPTTGTSARWLPAYPEGQAVLLAMVFRPPAP